ncbi:hypothetical protein [Haloactinomyces albus]|uniref:Uncharacterized protein n=1 Tax=Haloactinomyces albus TaxID=1352928 RepID=A0AAE3ZDN5_9ACTN|nr:hypothetical protein [Haloactinomyces albus]MDR7301891.1 hypothetical protein [Haloactinomyces albus]
MVVLHGIDPNDSSAYDGEAKSSLAPSLPLEATAPAACGDQNFRIGLGSDRDQDLNLGLGSDLLPDRH